MRWFLIATRAAIALTICAPAWSIAPRPMAVKNVYTPTAGQNGGTDPLDAVAFIAGRFDARASNVGLVCGDGWIAPSSASATGGSIAIVCPNGEQVTFGASETSFIGVLRDRALWVTIRRTTGAKRVLSVGFDNSEQAAAIKFADFWHYLATSRPVSEPAADAPFQALVQSDRAAPENDEQLRRVQVQAETLLKGNRTLEVARMYRTTLLTDAAWSQGHYNLALVYGSLELYPEAITEMRRYLYLDPEAADARAAKDQIYGWEALLPPAKAASP